MHVHSSKGRTGQKVNDENSRSNAEDATLGVHFLSTIGQLSALSSSSLTAPCPNAHHIRIDLTQAPRSRRPADGGMFCQCFTNPPILSFVGSNNDHQTVPSSIVGMKQVRDNS